MEDRYCSKCGCPWYEDPEDDPEEHGCEYGCRSTPITRAQREAKWGANCDDCAWCGGPIKSGSRMHSDCAQLAGWAKEAAENDRT